MRKQIVHIITSLGQGGAEKQLRYIVTGLRAKGYKQTVIVLRNTSHCHPELVSGSHANKNEIPKRVQDDNVKPYEIIYFNFSKGLRFLPELLKLVRYLKVAKPDILQTWLYHADLVGFIAGKLAGCQRIFWNIRCSDMNLKKYSPVTSLILSVLAKLSNKISGIVCNSQSGIDFHKSIGYKNNNWLLIPNGFNVPSSIAEKSSGKIIFGMVARVDPMKDYATYIAAAQTIHQLHPNAHFLCIGTGTEQFTDLSNNINGLGSCNNVPELLQTLDVFVLTSLSEGLPNVVGEAMVSGLPCIVTDVGDVRSLVGGNGIIIKPGSKEELIHAMDTYIKSKKLKTIGSKARAHIIKNYSLKMAISAYDTLYTKA